MDSPTRLATRLASALLVAFLRFPNNFRALINITGLERHSGEGSNLL